MRTFRRLRSESGYSLVELLVSSTIMLVVTGAIFGLMHPSQGTASTQPEVADLQQRTRVGSETLFKELVMAGAGVYQGPVTGSLINFFAPIIPRRMGRTDPDDPLGPDGARSDVITLAYIPNTYSQTTISSPMPNVSAELKVTKIPNCPKGDELCGFEEGMDVIVFDTSGNFDVFTITEVQDAAAHLQHRQQDLSIPYEVGASVTQIVSNTYYWCSPVNGRPCPEDASAWQLRRYDGYEEDVPIVDNVVDLRFEYFGDPNPPVKPKPVAGVANCLYDATGNYVAGLGVLATIDGSLAELPISMLMDGPWCGGGNNRFDADLLRVRKVRVTLSLQVADPMLRGTETQFWRNPGTSPGGGRQVHDYTVAFDITPRNLNLAR
jgi:hypothetical protein